MGKLEKIYKEGVALEFKGCPEEALIKYKEGLKEQASDEERMFVAMFHRHIAVIYEQMGEMLKAKRSFLNALKHGRPDAYIYLWLGDLSVNRGEMRSADKYYSRCEELAILEKDEDLLGLIAKRKYPQRTRRKTR